MKKVAFWRHQSPRALVTEFIGYTAASAVALVVDISILVFLVSGGMHYAIAATLAFLAGMLVVYLASIRWIFGWREFGERQHLEISVFLCTGVVGLGMNVGILWLGTEVLGLYYLVSKAVSVVFVFTWNFLSRKSMLFTPQAHHD